MAPKEELLGANLNLGQGSSMKIDNRRCQLLMRISRGDRGCRGWRGRQRLRLPPGIGLEKNVVVSGLSELRGAGGPCLPQILADYAHHTTTYLPPPPDFQTFLRPSVCIKCSMYIVCSSRTRRRSGSQSIKRALKKIWKWSRIQTCTKRGWNINSVQIIQKFLKKYSKQLKKSSCNEKFQKKQADM